MYGVFLDWLFMCEYLILFYWWMMFHCMRPHTLCICSFDQLLGCLLLLAAMKTVAWESYIHWGGRVAFLCLWLSLFTFEEEQISFQNVVPVLCLHQNTQLLWIHSSFTQMCCYPSFWSKQSQWLCSGFDLLSLMTSDVECTCMVSLDICISSWKKSILKSFVHV